MGLDDIAQAPVAQAVQCKNGIGGGGEWAVMAEIEVLGAGEYLAYAGEAERRINGKPGVYMLP